MKLGLENLALEQSSSYPEIDWVEQSNQIEQINEEMTQTQENLREYYLLRDIADIARKEGLSKSFLSLVDTDNQLSGPLGIDLDNVDDPMAKGKEFADAIEAHLDTVDPLDNTEGSQESIIAGLAAAVTLGAAVLFGSYAITKLNKIAKKKEYKKVTEKKLKILGNMKNYLKNIILNYMYLVSVTV